MQVFLSDPFGHRFITGHRKQRATEDENLEATSNFEISQNCLDCSNSFGHVFILHGSSNRKSAVYREGVPISEDTLF